MKKRIMILLFTAISAAMLLTACTKKQGAGETGEDATENEADEGDTVGEESEFTSEYGLISDGAQWGYNIEGSAVSLEGKTAIVTVALYEEDEPFAKGELESMKSRAGTALDFISTQAKEYGKTCEFVFDEADLNLEYTYDDTVDDFEYDDYDSILEELVNERLDTAKIREKYGADGIAYLFLLNGTGDSFASAHWFEDEEFYFNEGAYIFKTSYDDYYDECETGPNVYAYELLQLFGAVTLDFPDATSGFTAALADVVSQNYNNDIMLGYFEEDGSMDSEAVTKEITDITAYALGLIDSFDELGDNPSFTKDYKYSFVDNYMKNTDDGEDTTEYDYVPTLEDMSDDDFFELEEADDISENEIDEEDVDGEEEPDEDDETDQEGEYRDENGDVVELETLTQ